MNGFEWDPRKAEANLTKHGVDFADAAVSLEDPHALTAPDPDAADEERFVTMAMDPHGRILISSCTRTRARIGESFQPGRPARANANATKAHDA